jgi:hypothetical protein
MTLTTNAISGVQASPVDAETEARELSRKLKAKAARRMTQLLFKCDLSSNNDLLATLITSLLDAATATRDRSDALSEAKYTASFTSILSSVFEALDTDDDGFLTASDFCVQGTGDSNLTIIRFSGHTTPVLAPHFSI